MTASAAIRIHALATSARSRVVKVTSPARSGTTGTSLSERLPADQASVMRLTPAMVMPSEEMNTVRSDSGPENMASGR